MATAAASQARARRRVAPGVRGGGEYVSELQYARLLDATFAVVAEQGYQRLTARKVSGWAGVSNKTFYDLFSDREDCFLAAFDQAMGQLAAAVVPAWEGEREWTARVRAGLGALLSFLDVEPALCWLVFVEALGAGPRVLARRAEVLEALTSAVDEGGAGVRAGRELPPLTAEGIVGAAFSVIYARLIQPRPESLAGLLGGLVATIVLPYRGHQAAADELARLAPEVLGAEARGGESPAPVGHATPVDFRLTVRTHKVLLAVAELRGGSNREVADAAGVRDQGQISKLLARLEGHGLLTNTGGETQGKPNAWQLTSHGEEVIRASHPLRNGRAVRRPESKSSTYGRKAVGRGAGMA